MKAQYNLTVSITELEELNGFVNLLDCSKKLKLKIMHLYGYARQNEKAEKTKMIYDRLVSEYSSDE